MGTPEDSPLKSLTLASTLRALDSNLRAATSRTLGHILRAIRASLHEHSLDTALRHVDRAWRCEPVAADTLAPLYGRLLSLGATDHAASLRLLERVSAPDPDVAALTVNALLLLQRGDDALRCLESALADFCVAPGGLLECVAAQVLADSNTDALGWIGLGPTLEFTGELKGSEPATSLQIHLESGTEYTQLIRTSVRNGRRVFHFKLPHEMHDAAPRISFRGLPLLGGDRRMPSEFGVDGRSTGNGGLVTGWARVGWMPEEPVRLLLEDEDGRRRWTRTRNVADPGYRWPFRIDPLGVGLRGSRIQISAQLPNGRAVQLPDSPLLLPKAARLAARNARKLPHWRSAELSSRVGRSAPKHRVPIDVIVPIFRGLQESLACLDAALATLIPHAQVVVVNDATDDAALAAMLDELAVAGRITLLRNDTNLGFVASVNRALALHTGHDVVLLNSDALVFGDWLKRMRDAAYSEPKVGSVTPFSNSGSVVSYPHAVDHPISLEEAAATHALAASVHSGVTVDIPVGVGFCLYVRRDCLREAGDFDASVFGKGYGEETDFCLRARQHGWSHRLAADVFVYHAGGSSFGDRRDALLERSRRLINLRHPGYDRFVAEFLALDPLRLVRRRLDEGRLASFEGQFVLLVTLALTGGVERFVAERALEIRARGLFPLILRPVGAGNARRCELWTDAIDAPNLRYEIPAEIRELTRLLGGLRIDTVEIQHFLHLDATVIDAVRTLHVPYDVFVHDYAWVCPRITLIDGSGRYCGEPEVSVCNACVRRNGSNLGEKISVTELRGRSASWLRGARHVFAPTGDTAVRLGNYFPELDVVVRPHASPVVSAPAISRPNSGAVVRVAVIGAIGEHKGYSVLLNCARDAKARRLPLEFIVIGYTENDASLLKTGKVFITGRYSEGEGPHLLRRERPDITFLPSVWPETWSYTLGDALATGLPVVAFDLGAIAERLRASGRGVLLPLDCVPRHINDRIMESAAQRPLSNEHQDAMIRAYGDTNMNKSSNADSLLQEGLSASVQILPLPAGLYLFSVKAASPSPNQFVGQLQLPAMHVGLGPGVRSEQVEFVAGPSTAGAWLFAQDDMLVTKITGTGATLMLTSVRAPGGEVLSIKVERLDSRSDATASAAAASAQIGNQAAPASARAATPKTSPKTSTARDGALPLQIVTHIRARGDMTFTDVPWAGRVAPGLWIESFAIKPLERFEASEMEHKGLTGSGFETPWVSNGQMCGTKGMSVPLVGFAVRLKPSPRAANYDCEYSGYFKSGAMVGPLRNGAPCRSTVANDALEGIQVHIYKRSGVAKAAEIPDRLSKEQDPPALRPPASKSKARAALKSSLAGNRKQNGAIASKQRPIARRS